MPWPGQTLEDCRHRMGVLYAVRKLRGECPACGDRPCVKACAAKALARGRKCRAAKIARGECVRCWRRSRPGLKTCQRCAWRRKGVVE